MRFAYTVTIEVERVSGKFASKEDIADVITEALESVDLDLSGLGADGDSEYEMTDLTLTPVGKQPL